MAVGIWTATLGKIGPALTVSGGIEVAAGHFANILPMSYAAAQDKGEGEW